MSEDFMDDKAFKKTTRFLEGAKIKSLTSRMPFAGLAAIKTPTVEIKAPQSGCKVFLVGGDGPSPSPWHLAELEHLESESAPLDELEAVLENHVGRIMTPEERRQAGLKAAAKLTVAEVVADDSRKLVFLNFKSDEMDIHEHGLVAVRENAKWRLEDVSFVSSYICDSAVPEDGGVSTMVSLVGRWVFDELATINMLEKKGGPGRWISESVNLSKDMEWIITESKFVQNHPTHGREYRLVSIEVRKNICELTVEAPGMKFPEVWKLKLKGDQLFGGCVMKREAAPK
jgi:hypothetical protein